MELLGNKQAFAILTKSEQELICTARIRPHKIIADKSKPFKTSFNLLLILNRSLNQMLHNRFTYVGESQIKISLYDFSVYVETIYLYWRNAEANNEENGARFKACFPVFDDEFLKLREAVYKEVRMVIDFITYTFSDSFRYILFCKPEDTEGSAHSVFSNNYLLEALVPDTEILTLDGHNRTVYKLYQISRQKFIPLTLLPEKLGIERVLQKLPVQVYIQKHALERMEERLNEFFSMCNYGFIIYALISDKILPAGKPFSYLFPLEYQNVKLGYFKGDLTGGKLIIRTFLFITNNGTPEGRKLETLLGLQKADKKYFGIDKLSTFINSDIRQDEKLMDIFRQAGCGGLVHLKIKLIGPDANKDIVVAQHLAEYVGLENIPAEA